jgi:hypothetical protein
LSRTYERACRKPFSSLEQCFTDLSCPTAATKSSGAIEHAITCSWLIRLTDDRHDSSEWGAMAHHHTACDTNPMPVMERVSDMCARLELAFFWIVACSHGLNDVEFLESYISYTLIVILVFLIGVNWPIGRWVMLGGVTSWTNHYRVSHPEMIASAFLRRDQIKRLFRVSFVVCHAMPRILMATETLHPVVVSGWIAASIPIGLWVSSLSESLRESLFVALAVPHMLLVFITGHAPHAGA